MAETALLDAILSGLVTGSVIALGAVSLSLVYSIAKVPNFAHGEFITLGAYFALVLNNPASIPLVGGYWVPLWVGLVFAIVAGASLGGSLELGLFRPFRRNEADLITMIIVTMGLSFILRNVVIFVVGPGSRTYDTQSVVSVFYDLSLTTSGLAVVVFQRRAGDLVRLGRWGYTWPFLAGTLVLSVAVAYAVHRRYPRERDSAVFQLVGPRAASVLTAVVAVAIPVVLFRGAFIDLAPLYETRVSVNAKHVAILALSLLVMGGLHAMLKMTKVGTAMRATADNIDLAHVTGVNIDRVQLLVWTLAGVLTAFAGVLTGWFASLHPNMGFNLLLPVFAAVIVGGITSPYGAVAASFIIGLSMDVGVFLLPASSSRYRIALPFVILLLVILVKPEGLWEGY